MTALSNVHGTKRHKDVLLPITPRLLRFFGLFFGFSGMRGLKCWQFSVVLFWWCLELSLLWKKGESNKLLLQEELLFYGLGMTYTNNLWFWLCFIVSSLLSLCEKKYSPMDLVTIIPYLTDLSVLCSLFVFQHWKVVDASWSYYVSLQVKVQ